jgi:glutamyl-tRNA synthetase
MIPKVRFAPSPTGFLHVGNIRTAIINFLFAKKFNGQFILRLDDTDTKRVKDEYREMIFQDMAWLKLDFAQSFKQSQRLEIYQRAKEKLIASGRLYECFESEEELNLQRKSQIASGLTPIYNRNALKLTSEQKQNLRNQGIKPHYRFLLNDQPTTWDDKIKGKITYDGRHFSDPVLVRGEDETGFSAPVYTFCSVVDDIDMNITDIIRGEDHVTNTAIQIQIFEALGAQAPNFAHLALIQASSGKISKREGGFDIKTLRQEGYEAMSIINLLSQLGTGDSLKIYQDFQGLIDNFAFEKFSKSATNYDILELRNINQKLLAELDFKEVHNRLNELNIGQQISEKFWHAFKANLNFLPEITDWIKICFDKFRYQNSLNDQEFLKQCLTVLPQDTSAENAWQIWLDAIKKISSRKGKELFMPIRLALTGKEHGPELKHLVNFIERTEIIARLSMS